MVSPLTSRAALIGSLLLANAALAGGRDSLGSTSILAGPSQLMTERQQLYRIHPGGHRSILLSAAVLQAAVPGDRHQIMSLISGRSHEVFIEVSHNVQPGDLGATSIIRYNLQQRTVTPVFRTPDWGVSGEVYRLRYDPVRDQLTFVARRGVVKIPGTFGGEEVNVQFGPVHAQKAILRVVGSSAPFKSCVMSPGGQVKCQTYR